MSVPAIRCLTAVLLTSLLPATSVATTPGGADGSTSNSSHANTFGDHAVGSTSPSPGGDILPSSGSQGWLATADAAVPRSGGATAAHRTRVPGARAHGYPLVDAPMSVPGPVLPQEPSATRKLPRVIGWLYRWVRGYDVERSSTPAPQLYLRSPLLAGINEPVGCRSADDAADTRAPTCVAVTTSDGQEHLATYLVSLPQLGARTPAELKKALRERVDRGERIRLRTLGGGVAEIEPAKAVEIYVRTCESEIV